MLLLRLVWIFTVVPLSKSYETLLAVYPISWVITGISVCTAYAIIRRKAFSLSVPYAIYIFDSYIHIYTL